MDSGMFTNRSILVVLLPQMYNIALFKFKFLPDLSANSMIEI